VHDQTCLETEMIVYFTNNDMYNYKLQSFNDRNVNENFSNNITCNSKFKYRPRVHMEQNSTYIFNYSIPYA